MFSLLKKLVVLALFLFFVSWALGYRIGGKPVRDYLVETYRSPLVQELIRQGKEAVQGYLHKDVANPLPQDQITDPERQELEKVLERESKR